MTTETLTAEPRKRPCCMCGRLWDDSGLSFRATVTGSDFESVLADFEARGCEALEVRHLNRRTLTNLQGPL